MHMSSYGGWKRREPLASTATHMRQSMELTEEDMLVQDSVSSVQRVVKKPYNLMALTTTDPAEIARKLDKIKLTES